MNETVIRLGVALRQTEDQLTRDMLNSTASYINCVGGANGDNPTELTRSDIDTVIRTLVNNNAYTISDMIEGEDRLQVRGDLKPLVIDMEARWGDMAQAEAA